MKHDVIAFVSSVAESVGDEGRFLHLGLHLERRRRHRVRDPARATRPTCCSPGLDRPAGRRADAGAPPQAHADDRPHATASTPSRSRSASSARAGTPSSARDRARLAAARAEIALRQALRRGRDLREQPTRRSRRRSSTRLGLAPGADRDAGRAARPPRRLLHDARRPGAARASASRLEIRHLQRTEVRRGARSRSARARRARRRCRTSGTRSSPRTSAGIARLVRGYALAALENMALWHERDISHSSVERVIAPDATIALDFALARARRRGRGARGAARRRWRRTSRACGGAIFSEQVLLALVRRGVARDEAYRWIQRHALAGGDLAGAPRRRRRRARVISTPTELASLFDMHHSLRHIDDLFARALEDG